MMTRIHRVEMDHLCNEITDHATALGLIPGEAVVQWVPGGKGIAPRVEVSLPRADGTTTTYPVSFLPEFGYKDTTRDAFRALSATEKVLYVLANRQ